MNEVEILSVGEHRKKLSCVWSRIKSTTIGANDAAPGSRDEAVVHSEDLMVSEPDRHLKWMSRLTTSMKLSILSIMRSGSVPVPHYFLCDGDRGGLEVMATKEEKKENIKRQIITAAKTYSLKLAGKTFLYVYGDEYFEVLFKTDRFLHLTGVETRLHAGDFYQKAKDGTLDVNQFYFTPTHSMGSAKKKLPCLNRLPELTNTMVCVVKSFRTVTLTYTLGLTNLEFTLGLTENMNGRNNLFFPRTLRVKDKSIDMSVDGEIVDFIFMKDASLSTYRTLLLADTHKTFPKSIASLIAIPNC